jgi:hypothetical protein
MNIRLLLIAALLTLIACGGLGTPPVTTAGEKDFSKDYPKDKYMSEVGMGQSEPEAKNRAKAELSLIFESRIRTDTLDQMRSVLASSGAEQFEQSIESKIKVESNVELQGLEIARVWKKGATYYALAVLERAKAHREWSRRVSDMD